MILIHDNKNNIVAYLFDQLIISVVDNNLMGLILGHYVYNSHSKLVGIYFKNKIIDRAGETIAVLQITLSHRDELFFNKHQLNHHKWSIIGEIKEHVCSFVEEKLVWSKKSFFDVLVNV